MKHTQRLCVSIAFASLLSLQAQAQSELPTNPALERAIVVEEIEHDSSRALELYAALANNTQLPDELRRHAALRLGRTYAKLGNHTAAHKALAKAAAGEDAIAQQAQSELADPGRDEKRAKLLREEARRWIEEVPNQWPGMLFPQFHTTSNAALKNLGWIGSSAVPEIIRAIELAREQLPRESARLTHLAGVLWRIGGTDAARYLDSVRQSPAVEFRWCVAVALAAEPRPSDEMVQVAERYLADSEPRVAIAALGDSEAAPQSLWTRYSSQSIIALVDSPATEIRKAALIRISQSWRYLHHPLGQVQSVALLSPGLLRSLDDINPEVVEAAHRALGSVALVSRASRALLVQRMPTLREDFRLGGEVVETLAANEPAVAGLPHMLNSLGQRSEIMRTGRAGATNRLLTVFLEVLDRSSLGLVLQFSRLGYDERNSVPDWIKQTCNAQDGEQILTAMVQQPELESLLEWFGYADSTRQLSANCLSPLLEVERRIAGREAEDDSQLKLFDVVATLGSIGTQEAVGLILDRLAANPNDTQYGHSVGALLAVSERRSDEDVLAAMRRALVFELSPDQNAKDQRSFLFARLVELGDERVFGLFSRARALGMQSVRLLKNFYPPSSPFIDQMGDPLDWLTLEIEQDGKRLTFHGFDEQRLAKIWDGLLGAPLEDDWGPAWSKLRDALGGEWDQEVFRNNHDLPARYSSTSSRLVEVAAKHWTERAKSEPAPGPVPARSLAGPMNLDLRQMWSVRDGLRFLLDLRLREVLSDGAALAALDRLHAACFVAAHPTLREFAVEFSNYDSDPATRKAIEAALSDSEYSVAMKAIERVFAAGQPVSPELFAQVLKSSSRSVRREAVRVLASRVGEPAVELVKPLIEDPQSVVRIEVCRFLGTQVSANPVPELLTALTDVQPEVRAAAAESLRALRFYHDEKAHWDRVFAGNLLSANSAAEALLQQARSTNTREVRLLAIRSLGTLGAAETLPFLIEWTADSDSEIASAARAAIARIHAKGE